MKDIKILHISQALGGVKTYLNNLISNSANNQVSHFIIAPDDPDLQAHADAGRMVYYPFTISRSINPITDFISLIKIIRFIKKSKPDIVHAHSAKGGFLGRLAGKICGKKVVFTPHAFSYLPFTGFKRMIFFILEAIAKRWTNRLVAVSHSEANRARFEVGFKKEKITVINNAIPLKKTNPVRDYSLVKHVGMIGRLTYQKNPLLFLEIAKQIINQFPQIHFSILGAGFHDHLIVEINEFIDQNNLDKKISLLPWGDQTTSDKFLNEIDIYVMTSVFEGLPYSLLEAMEKGLPCIVSKVDGNTDVIQSGENGFACSTAQEFSDKISSLINDELLRARVGEAAHLYVREKHNIQDAIMLLEQTYLQMSMK